MEEKKKSKVGLLIAIIAIIAIAVVVVLFVFPMGGSATPEEATIKVMEALASGDEKVVQDAYHPGVEPMESLVSLYGFYDIQKDSISASETTKRTTDADGVNRMYGISVSDAKVMEVEFKATYMGTTEDYITYVSVAKAGGKWHAVMVDSPIPVRLLNK